MPDSLIDFTPSAYRYPLLIKQLLHAPMTQAADQEIVYRDLKRYTYRDLNERIARLANALAADGRQAWRRRRRARLGQPPLSRKLFRDPDDGRDADDRERAPFARAGALHGEPCAAQGVAGQHGIPVAGRAAAGSAGVGRGHHPADRRRRRPAAKGKVLGEYEALLAAASPEREFEDFDENTRATMFYTTGTTGQPKGVYFSHRQLVLHALIDLVAFGTPATQGRFHREDVYMPITPMFHVHGWGLPYAATAMGVKQVYPGPLCAGPAAASDQDRGRYLQPLRADHPADAADAPGRARTSISPKLKMVIGGSALTKALAQAGDGARHRHFRRLRHVRVRPDPHGGAVARRATEGQPSTSRPRRGSRPARRCRWSTSASSMAG